MRIMMFKILLLLNISISLTVAAGLINIRATLGSESYFIYPNDLGLRIAVNEDTIVTGGQIAGSKGKFWLVFREINGQYINVAQVAGEVDLIFFPFNNGRWMGGFDGADVTLFRLDGTDNPVNKTTLPLPGNLFVALLSDNTVVNAISGGFASTLFNEDSLTWSDGPTLDVANLLLPSHPFYSMWIDDNHIVCMNDSLHTFIFTRQSDKSWLETDNFPFNVSLNVDGNQVNLYSNGEDTVVFASSRNPGPGSSIPGYLVFYTKVDNEWLEQVIYGEEFGLTEYPAILGEISFSKIDQDTLLFGAPYAAYNNERKRGGPDITEPVGRVFIVQRKNNVWTLTAEISTPDVGLLGVTVGVSNKNIITTFGEIEPSNVNQFYRNLFYTTPLCLAPINISCAEPPDTPTTAPTPLTPITAPSTAPTKTPASKSVSGASHIVHFSVFATLLGLFNLV